MSDPAAGPPGPRRHRVLGTALVLSLAVNLLVLGVVLGMVWTRGGVSTPRAVQVDFGAMRYAAALEPADRAALRAAWRDRGPALRDLRVERQSDLATALEILPARPFDPAALEAVLVRQGARAADRQSLARELLVERVAAMTEAERAAYADRLQTLAQRRGRDARQGPAWRDRAEP